ncbi:hypothetical protein LJC49_06655 [Ruminococcaceae bacterium OttesenSCG-928-I18]|nr:hypothetical protein [Ruminococcaceae bacterium OttesenSCG-928-I18]
MGGNRRRTKVAKEMPVLLYQRPWVKVKREKVWEVLQALFNENYRGFSCPAPAFGGGWAHESYPIDNAMGTLSGFVMGEKMWFNMMEEIDSE